MSSQSARNVNEKKKTDYNKLITRKKLLISLGNNDKKKKCPELTFVILEICLFSFFSDNLKLIYSEKTRLKITPL